MGVIKGAVGAPAAYEQLAEECVELAKEALKVARVLRNENPTNRTLEESVTLCNEEYTDVIQCAEEVGLIVNRSQIREKEKRFMKRWEQHGS